MPRGPRGHLASARLAATVLRGAPIFAHIRVGDLLLHHPCEDFETSVARFIRSAADDPRVLALKMTVYR